MPRRTKIAGLPKSLAHCDANCRSCCEIPDDVQASAEQSELSVELMPGLAAAVDGLNAATGASAVAVHFDRAVSALRLTKNAEHEAVMAARADCTAIAKPKTRQRIELHRTRSHTAMQAFRAPRPRSRQRSRSPRPRRSSLSAQRSVRLVIDWSQWAPDPSRRR